MTRLFGTDGIRGTFGVDLTVDIARRVASALGHACRRGVLGGPSPRPRVVVGRDTRPSGPALENAVVEGLLAAGCEALLAGVLPTPAVAFLAASLPADAGVVISASHNPPVDNGLKFFGPGGWKFGTAAEVAITELAGDPPDDEGGGACASLDDANERYMSHLCRDRSLTGVRVVVDCANGAASFVGPESMRRLGADVTATNASADGSRINDGCGAMYPGVVAAAAERTGAVGVTLDGDADRVLLADERGRLVDGDALLAILARHLRDDGRLRGGAVVVTVMANQALRRWCAGEGIEVVETAVGDRHVLEAMRERGITLGGEQSGHVIVLDRTTTGDGILTAIEALDAVDGRLAGAVPFEPFPQVLVNVATNGRAQNGELVRAAIERAERRLGGDGRVLVRPSGTEPVVRVMVESPDAGLAADLAEHVAAAVRRETA
jgi:phosphoglucosamine mutase